MAWYGRDYESNGYRGGYGPARGMESRENRGWNGRGFRGSRRVTYAPRHHGGYRDDRDLGDTLREGWQGLKRGVQNAFGNRGGYERGGYDRSYEAIHRGRDLTGGRYRAERGPRGNRFGTPYGDRGGYPAYGRGGYDRGWF